jgi:VIT1/CCC1 family predicted Fe2+/Mn2+ transporter
MPIGQGERHRGDHVGWLRAAVLGANDGIISTASLLLGVAAAHGTRSSILVAGVAGLVAGAMAMAAGEYVSVHSQADSEQADLERERAELRADDKGEHEELAAIYVSRGLDPSLAKQVADQLMAHDAIGAHTRDELGISEILKVAPASIGIVLAAVMSLTFEGAMAKYRGRSAAGSYTTCTLAPQTLAENVAQSLLRPVSRTLVESISRTAFAIFRRSPR